MQSSNGTTFLPRLWNVWKVKKDRWNEKFDVRIEGKEGKGEREKVVESALEHKKSDDIFEEDKNFSEHAAKKDSAHQVHHPSLHIFRGKAAPLFFFLQFAIEIYPFFLHKRVWVSPKR